MGGVGSGSHDHWWRPARKTTTEECLILDANRWTRDGLLRAGGRDRGAWAWTDCRTGAEAARIAFAVDTTDPGDPWARLSYTVGPTGEPVDDRVGLGTTRPPRGGARWWFVCPGPPGGGPCGRRVGRLYLPPGGRHFGCRHCHALTYTSCRESRSYDSLLRQMAVVMDLSFEEAKRAFPTRRDPGWCWYPAAGRRPLPRSL
jgi:hypothetical protein